MERRRRLQSTAVRTLMVSGYRIVGVDTHPRHIEIRCERPSRLGALLRFRIAIAYEGAVSDVDVKAAKRTAESDGMASIFVGHSPRLGQTGWNEFLRVMGGAVPSWRALTPDYGSALETAARNKRPKGLRGEVWAIFEDLVAEGFEFTFGRRVERFGGRRRGLRVSDMIAPLPDGSLLIIDAKAYASGLNVTWPSLRPLREYVENQVQYQAGQNKVLGAVLISHRFLQGDRKLMDKAQEFFNETRVPLGFMQASTLASLIADLRRKVDIRSAVRWHTVFGNGAISYPVAAKAIKRATVERYDRGDD